MGIDGNRLSFQKCLICVHYTVTGIMSNICGNYTVTGKMSNICGSYTVTGLVSYTCGNYKALYTSGTLYMGHNIQFNI